MAAGRIEAVASEVAAREAGRAQARQRARELADWLRQRMLSHRARFVAAVEAAGASHLDLIEITAVEPDDKSIRAFQFKIRRGRYEAVVVSKDRGEVMMVGPFKRGQDEGPCNPIHHQGGDPDRELLADHLETFLSALIEMSFTK